MTQKYTVGLIQMRCSNDKKENLAKATSMLQDAAKKGVNVACMPELFMTEYFCQKEDPALFDLAEPLDGPTTHALQDIAKKTGMIIINSIFEKRTAGLYHNSALVIEKTGDVVGTYRKMHIPHDPLFYEKYYFTPGDLGFKAHDTSVGKIGTLICWDQWYPEGARATALQGADILFYPTAIGWQPADVENDVMLTESDFKAQLDAWITIQRSHAVANGVYVAAVNRIGHEGDKKGGINFWGNSFIADPFGKIIAQGSGDKEEIVMAEVNLDLVDQKRRYWPFLRDRRIDAYGDLTKRWGV